MLKATPTMREAAPREFKPRQWQKPGIRFLLKRYAAPILLLLVLLDTLLWALFRFGFDACYGIWCLV